MCVQINNGLAENGLNWLIKQRQSPIVQISPLAGLTACSQLIELANGERYIWRKQSDRASNYGINYQAEAMLLQELAPLGFTPKVVYSDAQGSLLNWIEGAVPSAFSNELLEKLARYLARLHHFDWQAVKNSQNFAILNLAERCTFLWEKLPDTKQKQLSSLRPFRQITPLAQAVCHHDLHLGNLLLQDNSLFIIDWEYAALSDPALDIALFFESSQLTSQQKMHFFTHYFAKNSVNLTAYAAKIKEYQPEIKKLNQLWFAL
ncbi:thiamine kinase [Nicoletella semolina]|uniref:Thiamine kinase n=1 Tax=Nicoletella semolina TaxID=271160 RepID=A0A4R2N696_9PAST|nr:choline/ethanolamine kinase family protein [Nicoletella semolina]MDH2925256.1 LPS biosynthesis choline kinase [Nicoletella semolina]TCP16341.1 thiamine kinase [Nicoletella semolina]